MNTDNIGPFAKLPPEIRLYIWEDLLSQREPDIMQTTRAIYDEISDRFYDAMEVHLTPVFGEQWIYVQCKGMRLQWEIKSVKHGLQQGFNKMPYHKINIIIHIYAPNPDDPAQIILLWQKVQGLVSIIEDVGSFKSVQVLLRGGNDHDWLPQNRRPLTGSVPRPGRPRYDRDVIFLPFSRLRGVKAMKVTPGTRMLRGMMEWRLINQGLRCIMRDRCSKSVKSNHQKKSSSSARNVSLRYDVNMMICDVESFLDTELDTLPGKTAAMLRLERFGRWYSDPYKSEYQDGILRRIRQYGSIIRTHDPDLQNLLLRYQAWDILNLEVERRIPSTCGRVDCQPRLWHRAYPDGIPEITEEWVRGERRRVIEKKRLMFQPVMYLNPERYEGFYSSILRYLQRNGNPELRVEGPGDCDEKWCRDCRRLGFRVGCTVGCENL